MFEAALDGATLGEMERRYILRVLKKMGGHQIKTAEVLGIDRRTLYRRLRQYGVEVSRSRGDGDEDDDVDFFDVPDSARSAAGSQ